MNIGDRVTIGHGYAVSAGLRGRRGKIAEDWGDHYKVRLGNGLDCFVQKGMTVEEGAPTSMPDEPTPIVVRWPAVAYLAVGFGACVLGLLWKLGMLP